MVKEHKCQSRVQSKTVGAFDAPYHTWGIMLVSNTLPEATSISDYLLIYAKLIVVHSDSVSVS